MSQSHKPSRSGSALISPSLEEPSLTSCIAAESFPARAHLSLLQTGKNHQSVRPAQQ